MLGIKESRVLRSFRRLLQSVPRLQQIHIFISLLQSDLSLFQTCRRVGLFPTRRAQSNMYQKGELHEKLCCNCVHWDTGQNVKKTQFESIFREQVTTQSVLRVIANAYNFLAQKRYTGSKHLGVFLCGGHAHFSPNYF